MVGCEVCSRGIIARCTVRRARTIHTLLVSRLFSVVCVAVGGGRTEGEEGGKTSRTVGQRRRGGWK